MGKSSVIDIESLKTPSGLNERSLKALIMFRKYERRKTFSEAEGHLKGC